MIREKRQWEAQNAFLGSSGKAIINACPRFGKIRVALNILTIVNPENILLCYPRTDILAGWNKEMADISPDLDVDTTSTFTSLKKVDLENNEYDFVIIDEPHELSEAQMVALQPIVEQAKYVLGLTGTMTKKTEEELYGMLGLEVCYKYTIEDGVREGILPDYRIIVHRVPLDNLKLVNGKTEKRKFNALNYLRSGKKGQAKMFFTLKMINLIQNSEAKLLKTKELIKQYENSRLLVFCGTTAIADSLNIPVYHSKSKEKKIFDDFLMGIGNHLACIKLLQAGITVKPISRGIINYMSGSPEDSAQKICRFLGYEYDNPDKVAEIHIVSSTEKFELGRIETALMFFDNKKIKYI